MKDKLIIGVLLSLLLFCCTKDPVKSRLPEKEAQAVERILEANGYSVNDGLTVDDYVKWYHSDDGLEKTYQNYKLDIPSQNGETLVLTDDFNALLKSEKFLGVESNVSINNISINTDSIIIIKGLYLFNTELNTLPSSINKLILSYLNISSNKLTGLPSEIVELSEVNSYFDDFTIYIKSNYIDTTKIDNSLHKWLDTVSSSKDLWWESQKVER